MLAFYGTLGVLVASLVWGPVQLRWWPLLGGTFGGLLLAQGAYALATRGRLTATRQSRIDQIYGARPPEATPPPVLSS